MFNETWYPTPKSLANKLSRHIDWKKVHVILDPSAGRGDLLAGLLGTKPDYVSYDGDKLIRGDVVYRLEYSIDDILAIEIDPTFREVLSKTKFCPHHYDAKPVKIIGSDFLSYAGYFEFDLIVMNPPFDQGAEHLLKAIEIMRKGQLLCILNKETIANPYCKSRELLLKKLKEFKHEIVDLGKPFTKGVERKTNVECVLVVIQIDKHDSFIKKIDLDLDNLKRGDTGDFTPNLDDEKFVVERSDVTERVVNYRKKIDLYKNVLQSIAVFRQYGGNYFEEIAKSYRLSFNQYVENLTRESWAHLVSLPRFTKYMTAAVKEQFYRHITNNSCMEFTEQNIYIFLDSLVYSFENIMDESLTDLFDKFTKYDKQNTTEKEGWWTNDSFRVNRKIIIPHIWDNYSISGYRVEYRRCDFFNDIERVMQWLSGEKLEEERNAKAQYLPKYMGGILDVIEQANKEARLFNVEHDSHFFKFRVYKKPYVGGTIHLEFKSEQLWQEFNIRAAEKKHWLPDDYKARRRDNIRRGMLIEYK